MKRGGAGRQLLTYSAKNYNGKNQTYNQGGKEEIDERAPSPSLFSGGKVCGTGMGLWCGKSKEPRRLWNLSFGGRKLAKKNGGGKKKQRVRHAKKSRRSIGDTRE